MKNLIKKYLHALICVILLIPAPMAFGADHEIKISGKTMGTTYHVTLVVENLKKIEGLKGKIDARLKEINQSMSAYIPDSEISRFNALESTERKFAVSPDFLEVLMVSKTVFQLSKGAWDCTINPLVNLWGFGPAKAGNGLPEKAQIEKALSHVGFNRIEIFENGFIQKKDPRVTLDLASIAKGFGVDKITELILDNDIKNCLVEIGGEVFAAGLSRNGKPWRVGINTPQKDAPFNEAHKVISLTGRAMATSGDYRNFIENGGRLLSHIIHPKTGYPVENGVASVSILAETCTFADGMATAVMVMGLQDGLDLIDRLEGVDGLIIVKNPDGTFTDHYSSGLLPSLD